MQVTDSLLPYQALNPYHSAIGVVTYSAADESKLRIQSSLTRQLATKSDRQIHFAVRQGCTEFRAETRAPDLLVL